MRLELNFDKSKTIILSTLIVAIITVALLALIFAVPLYSEIGENEETVSHYLMQSDSKMDVAFVGVAFLVIYLFCLIIVFSTVPYYLHDKEKFLRLTKGNVYVCWGVSLLFFIAGYVFQIIKAPSTDGTAYSNSFIPFIVLCFPVLLISILDGLYQTENPRKIKNKEKTTKYRIEPLIFVSLFTVGTFSTLFVNLIKMSVKTNNYSDSFSITGLKLLRDYAALGSGYQLLAFFMATVYMISSIGLILSLAGFFSKSDEYEKIAKTTSYANVFFTFLIAVSGLYFTIGQKMNEDNLRSIMTYYGFNVNLDYEYKIRSGAIYALVIDVVLLVVMIVRNVMRKKTFEAEVSVENAVIQATTETDKTGIQPDNIDASSNYIDELDAERELEDTLSKAQADVKKEDVGYSSSEEIDFDPCPAFTEIDEKKEQIERNLVRRKTLTFETPSLSSISQFVVDYARECRLHLSYSKADIATFIAGLGASRLAILQGMSGTGKTSLPKIFAEAICGVCDIVEVESSWKDKNELLGYYNEFTKTYTPKKFTCSLYKAALNSEVPTFIVLDEMNLSRIEYYFSDFLSLMENEENKRYIKLLNVNLKRASGGVKYDYLKLSEGHTLKIPSNVWFIGTANRDESTFEISDKVYDRAQTMNFNKRAPKVRNFNRPIPQRFIEYNTLYELLSKAKNEGNFDAEYSKLIRSVEEILLPFNISFGNRILKQIEDFVNVYCKCFEGENVLNVAVEKILLSKVVSKLEVKVIENKDVLVRRFEELGLSLCADFVSKLNED